MTDTALERARREAYGRSCEDCNHGWCIETRQAVARLEAAARLAGRVEQAEKQVEWCAPGKTIRRSMVLAWRDRLRAELAAAGKEKK